MPNASFNVIGFYLTVCGLIQTKILYFAVLALKSDGYMRQLARSFPFLAIILFFSVSGLAQNTLPAEGRIVYQVSSASNSTLDNRPVIREFHVTYNQNYIREEFVDEPHRFTITDRNTFRKRYAAGYFSDIPIEIEEDVSPQSFHTVESVQLRTIGGYPAQLYIVFVNNRWTDIFVHANETLQYPEILGVNGLAMEFTMPSEYGILNYRVKSITPARFDAEWFTFKPLQRITPPVPAEEPATTAAHSKTGLMNNYELARSNAFKYIDKLQEVSSTRRMLSPELQTERYDEKLAEERELLDQLSSEDYAMKMAVENFRAISSPSGFDSDDLTFLSEAARARRTVANVQETTRVDLEKAETARRNAILEAEKLAINQSEPARPDMQWRQSTQQQTQTAKTPREPQTRTERAKTQPERTIKEQEIVKTPEQVQTQEPVSAPEPPRLQPSRELTVPTPAKAPESPEQTISPLPVPESTELPGQQKTATREEAKITSSEAPIIQETREENISLSPANTASGNEDDATPHNAEVEPRLMPEEEAVSNENERLQPGSRQNEPGFVSLMDFVNKNAGAVEEARPRTPRNVIAEAPALNEVSGKLMNDEVFRLSDFRGKVVVLNFWFIACRPCIVEIPKLNDLVAEYEQEDIVFLAAGLDGKERVQDFLTRYPFDYQVVPSAMDIATQFGVSTYPTHIVLDKNGKILLAENGFTDHVKRQMIQAIEQALGR
jgi:peroxiredoxin